MPRCRLERTGTGARPGGTLAELQRTPDVRHADRCAERIVGGSHEARGREADGGRSREYFGLHGIARAMKSQWAVAALVIYLGSAPSAQEPRTWSGVLSESKCGASHQGMAASMGMSERDCAFHCLKGLSKYVLVDEQKNVIPIANQDFAGMPLRLGRPV